MNTKELKYFMEVCEAGNIKNAAERLYITPQGLSKVMRNLETELGVRLFIRSNNGIFLTECGELLQKKAGHMIQEMEDMLYDMECMKSEQDRIRLACSYGVLETLPPEWILNYMEKYPDITVEWKEYNDGEVEQAVSRNQADYGLLIGKVNTHIFEEKRLYSYPISLKIYPGHQLYKETEIDFPMLDGEKIIAFNRDSHMYTEFMYRCQREKVTPDIVFETTDHNFAHQLCKRKVGLVLTADCAAEPVILDGIKKIPFAGRDFRWQIYLIQKKGIKNSIVFETFEQFITDLTS